ncbi:AzlC family ABC transporter permease [Jannaschia seohaensis]|uniref:Predicted branched-chain amino acid permease (Azaleucine resistance) n=1 Tax=Jannaschia seohaensis TaxID=475081 RepID=A0A2Y9A176_9RHOB|nr:AzlC family ABC transporter permease [Jannaschia seohaensis]PWJ22013.1 putative branched-subunit amino acid permease [Jannaschia seohaensis]SSA38291.1 Predicted branched-chain amino acid permease (azaleucine resistance) [Jannaschia seohaensis]
MGRTPFGRGVAQGLPFLLIMMPFGALFGVVATEAGLSLTQVMVFSSIVIAGASQFAAVQLMVDGVPTAIVVLSALAVNLRMVMYSAALAPHLGPAPAWQRALMAYLLVDQVYALAQSAYDTQTDWAVADKVAYLFGVALPVFPGWVGATYLGAALGARIPESWSLDFAVPLAFIALVGPMLRTRAHVVAAFVSVTVALAFAWIPWNLGLILAALAAMAAGAEMERRA